MKTANSLLIDIQKCVGQNDQKPDFQSNRKLEVR